LSEASGPRKRFVVDDRCRPGAQEARGRPTISHVALAGTDVPISSDLCPADSVSDLAPRRVNLRYRRLTVPTDRSSHRVSDEQVRRPHQPLPATLV